MVLILSLFLMGRMNRVSASDVKGSVMIDYHVTLEQGQNVFPSGVQFVVYQIGSFCDGVGVLNDEFQPSGVSIEDASASARNRQAKELYAYANQKGLVGTTAETKDGKIEFANLDLGIYLIAQTKQYNYEQKGWSDSDPFLLSVPLEVNGEWTYQVRVEPKTAWTPIKQPNKPSPTTPSDHSTPHTGDDAHLMAWFIVALISASGVVSLKKWEP